MNNLILFLCDYAFRFPQRITWQYGFNLHKIFALLRDEGYFPIATHYEDPNLINLITSLKIHNCVPSTSWKCDYRFLVNSILPVLENMEINLIPRLELLLAYENKLIQVELGKKLNLETPLSFCVSTFNNLSRLADKLGYPFVIKEPEGFASSGVSIVRNSVDLNKIKRKYFKDEVIWTNGIGKVVVQEFIPGLIGDWKVIIIDNVCAVLYRGVRNDDFRASGSGIFKFLPPPEGLLDFALKMKETIATPWISLDIAEKNGAFFLLEFQATHFGTYTVDRSPFHYIFDGKWIQKEGALDVEYYMVKAILNFIRMS